jgi:hypothetical protein
MSLLNLQWHILLVSFRFRVQSDIGLFSFTMNTNSLLTVGGLGLGLKIYYYPISTASDRVQEIEGTYWTGIYSPSSLMAPLIFYTITRETLSYP